jgi:hypothetical protein
MKKIVLTSIAGLALLTSAAGAAPLSPGAIGSSELSNIEQVRMVCNEYGRCWHTRGPRYVERYVDDDSYVVRRGYYDRPYGYYGGGPSIGFSFGTGRW